MDLITIGTTASAIAVAACVIAVATGLARHRHAPTALHIATAATTVALGALIVALLTGAFEIAYVADTTTRLTPAPYRLSGLWGSMEGSLLFWAWFHLLLGSIAVSRLTNHRPTVASVVAAVGGTEVALGLVLSPAFVRLAIPAVNGNGLVAVLRHPAMIVHPPLIYLGLTATLVPFAVLVAAARRDATGLGATVAAVRPWLRLAWFTLTAGMLLGASWAYVEAGWGGFWAWDAVENTSLLPWLAVTGALHAAGNVEREPARVDVATGVAFVAFTVLAFASTALGVVLTRSGTTGSVHAFAEAIDTGRGLLVLAVVAVTVGAVTGARLVRHLVSPAEGVTDPYLLTNHLVIAVAWLVVAAGTFVPTVAQLVGGAASTTDATFYARYAGPAAVVGLVALGLLAAGVRPRPDRATVRLVGLALAVPVGAAIAALALGGPPMAVAVSVAAALVIAAIMQPLMKVVTRQRGPGDRPRFRPALLAVHGGLALMLGAAAGSTLGEEARAGLAIGDSVQVDGRRFTLAEISTGENDEYLYVRARLTVDDDPEPIVTELRRYRGQIRPSSEASLHTSPVDDTIVILQDVDPSGTAARVSILVRPLVMWVWVGGLVMLAGAGRHALASTRTHRRTRHDEPRYRAATTTPRPAASTT